MIAGIISAIFGFISLVLGFRFVFRLFGANPQTPFVEWIYSFSQPFVAPFAGIFGQPALPAPGAVVQGVVEWGTLVGLLVFALVGGLLVNALSHPRTRRGDTL
jgi:hypothetical protein